MAGTVSLLRSEAGVQLYEVVPGPGEEQKWEVRVWSDEADTVTATFDEEWNADAAFDACIGAARNWLKEHCLPGV